MDENSERESLALHTLPAAASALLERVAAPPHLIAHLILVHDVAARLVLGMKSAWPQLPLDEAAVSFGAATHDVGKVRHPEEMTAPGEAHREAGIELLSELGIEPDLSRFARSHAAWAEEPEATLEDLVVALADRIWEGTRDEELEAALTRRVAEIVGSEQWEAYMTLEEIISRLAADAERRLLWQAQFRPQEGEPIPLEELFP